jgi:hypothetical protein
LLKLVVKFICQYSNFLSFSEIISQESIHHLLDRWMQ